ncbi:hypothetical protein, partial [Hydrogenibacillus schlegelii]|uniref:hypothetical protein n=1 Tax=Hydrogenibacillus schlegelii TaxID=1484 RepID=UPI0034A078E2
GAAICPITDSHGGLTKGAFSTSLTGSLSPAVSAGGDAESRTQIADVEMNTTPAKSAPTRAAPCLSLSLSHVYLIGLTDILKQGDVGRQRLGEGCQHLKIRLIFVTFSYKIYP